MKYRTLSFARDVIEDVTAIYTERHVEQLVSHIDAAIYEFMSQTFFCDDSPEEEPDGSMRDGMRGFRGGKLP